MPLGGQILLAVICIILSMLFSAAESAFLSVNKLRVRFLRRKNDKKALRAGKLLDHKEQLINTILIGNTTVNIALSAILTSIAMDLFGSAGIAAATFAATILLLIFGEITPKTIAAKHPEKFTFGLSGFTAFFYTLLHPLVVIFTKFVFFLAHLAGVKPQKKTESFTEEDIKTFMQVGEEEGVLAADEKTMMHRVFRFTDLEAKDILQPRTTMKVLPLTAKYRDAVELSQKSHYSRFPVYDTDIDDIKGILYMKDVLTYASHPADFSIKKVMRKALFIPETQKMSSIQQTLRENNQTIAIILDEYSGTAGLLTIEDISGEIFGSVNDEYDSRQASEITFVSEKYSLADAAIKLDKLSTQLETQFSSEQSETLGGLLLEKLGHIPEKGEGTAIEGWHFTIQKMEHHRIAQVLIERLSQEEQ